MSFLKQVTFLSLFLAYNCFSLSLTIEPAESNVTWHLHISKKTEVYGNIPVRKGNLFLSNEGSKGEISFDLSKTKSFELDEKEKQYSEGRDERIYKITSSKKFTPTFKIKSVKGLEPTKASSKLEIKGELSLNGVSKGVSLEGRLDKTGDVYSFSSEYFLEWEKFNIENPVIWILRVAKTADETIDLNFNLVLKEN